jgi:ATP-dependent RNA helicase DDX20
MNDVEMSENNDDKEHQQNGFVPRTTDIQVAEDFTFSKFHLSDKLLKSLSKLNFIKPSPVQLKVIPLAKCSLDMIIQAKSGTGKTLAFAVCLLENYDFDLKFPQALVVVPTREIAVQIVNVLDDLGKSFKNFRACEFIGGTDITNDRKRIQSAKVVVGTPGRIVHLINNEIFNISNLKTLVLDEADKLLEGGQMGKEVSKILKFMHDKIQIIATTATVTSHLEKVMKKVMKNPIGITPKHEIPVLLGIKQFVKVLPRESDNIKLMNNKIEELQKIFTRISFKQCLLFTDSQSKTESYGNYLNKCGWKNEVINGAQDQSQRLHVLDKLIKFKCRILITTDLMARGIDIENINLIINLDLPFDCCTYLHRIGRAGRFGSHGIAISFVNGEEDMPKFQKMLGDIGGSSLKALKYPDESVDYDFWNFDQQNEEILETISGISKKNENFKANGNVKMPKEEEETVMNNLALLEITRKLVDDKSKPAESFDLNAMIEDYENLSEEKIEVKQKKDEDIFLKTIEDLNLYDDENEKEKSKTKSEFKEERKVIFKRPAAIDDDKILLDNSSESDYDEVSSEEESDEELNDQEESFQFNHRNNQQHTSSFNNEQYSSYHQFVASNHSQWENIYYYQLANIQNYVESNRM